MPVGCGQFLSPDTFVPDPSNLFDYNRYLYTRGNPMKYTDPTGHCVNSTTKNASEPQGYDNADCWRYANTIANLWEENADYWNGRFTSKEVFLGHIANNAYNGTDFFKAQLNFFLNSDDYQGQQSNLPASTTSSADPMCGNDRACQAVVQHALYMEQKCQEMDCIGIGNDAVGIAGAGMVLLCPECGAVTAIGGALSNGSTLFGVGWTTYNWYNDRSSEADLAVTGELAYRSTTTASKPWGFAYSVIQFVWDVFVSPNDPWE